LAKDTGQTQDRLNPDTDNFVAFNKAMTRIVDEVSNVDGQPEHLEIHFLRNGEVTWRVHLVDRDETEGNVLVDL